MRHKYNVGDILHDQKNNNHYLLLRVGMSGLDIFPYYSLQSLQKGTKFGLGAPFVDRFFEKVA